VSDDGSVAVRADMSEEEEGLQRTRQGFEDLCRALNMDEEARTEAWKNYQNINKNYTLEGSELHWQACALYVACRTSVPTVGKGTAEGNYVSLTRILRCAELSLIEFFSKMKKWEDMANLPQEFRQRTDKLERNFTVSAVIFKKYVPIFQDIFRPPSDDPPRVQRGRKQRYVPLQGFTSYRFITLFLVRNFPMISDDLVNSYHLLLCALDLVYCNALLCSSRKELLNPAFKGLPADFGSRDFKPGLGPLCFIEQLCKLHDGLVLEAKGVKEHFWKPFIRKLFDKKVLKGKEESLTGFLDPANFGDSFMSLGRVYEERVLSTGSLDERIFLGETANADIGTPGPCLCAGGMENTEQPLNRLLGTSAPHPPTPLTGRRCAPDGGGGTPVSTAMQSVSRLHSLLAGLRNSPSERLATILRECIRDPSEAIASRLKDMSDLFCQHYQLLTTVSHCHAEVAAKYFRLAEALYYKILEAVIEQEKKRLGDSDLSVILEHDLFHRSLLVCCLEIVIFSYRPPGDFPRVIEIFDLPPYHFYKVIEVLVRAEEGLFREVVKHLNRIEEQVLESLAWSTGSPLWDSIREAKNHVPTCQEVSASASTRLPRFAAGIASRSLSDPVFVLRIPGLAPSPTTLHGRYSSPPASSARRRLFVDGETTSDPPTPVRVSQSPLISTIAAGQTVVTMATATVTANNGQTVTIPVQGIANENGGITFIPVQVSVTGQGSSTLQPLTAQTLAGTLNTQQLASTAPQATPLDNPSAGQQAKKAEPQSPATNKPAKTGSLSLFFRKVYHLASVRLRDLCAKLDISAELRRKIWTCFEYSLVHCTELMLDRHLDQLLMCAIYLTAKVTKEDKSFQNIMKCYRTQPQASSSVYRSVLISGRKRSHSGSSDHAGRQTSPSKSSRDSPVHMRSSSTLPVSQPSSAPGTPPRHASDPAGPQEEERGDLISFYNNVYIKQMRDFALRFSGGSQIDGPPLSPYPSLRTGSPRRVLLSHKHSIYISPHKNGNPLSPRDKIFYYICASPSKRLREINSMIRTGESPTKKRSMTLDDGAALSPAKRLCQENQTALLRRLQDVANDRGAH
uniref:RB transcriptional corepressor like 2 n=1 Tax=Scleropages formosus TaxID=113540 RepID=A0A8C9S9X3_SCLFO